MAKESDRKTAEIGRARIESAAGEKYEYGGKTYSVHPAAHLFPLLSGEDFDDLCQHIDANGVQDPVVVDGTTIIDGRTRLSAAIKVGRDDVKFVQIPEGADPFEFIIGANLRRRNLSPSQRSMIGRDMRAVSAVMNAAPAPTAPPVPASPPAGAAGDDGDALPGIEDLPSAGDGGSVAAALGDGDDSPPAPPQVVKRPSDLAATGGSPAARKPSKPAGGPTFEPAPSRATASPDTVAKATGEKGADGAPADPSVVKPTITQEEAASKMRVSRRGIARAEKIAEVDPVLARAVTDGVVTLNDALKVLDEPDDVRAAALEAVKAKTARTIVDAVAALSATDGARGAGAGGDGDPSASGAGASAPKGSGVDAGPGSAPSAAGRKRRAAPRKGGDTVSDDLDLPTLPDVGGAASTGAAPVSPANDPCTAEEVLSPPDLVPIVRTVLGGIDLDPASSERGQKVVQATQWFGRDVQGETQIWTGRVYCFPPLNLVDSFVDRLLHQLDSRDGASSAILLAPAVTGPHWAHRILDSRKLSACVERRDESPLDMAPAASGGSARKWRAPQGLRAYVFCVDLEQAVVQALDLFGWVFVRAADSVAGSP